MQGKLKKVIKYVLSGLQESNYPIGYTETNSVLREYMKLIHGREMDTRRIYPGNFIGPSSKTLQFMHIQEEHSELKLQVCKSDGSIHDLTGKTYSFVFEITVDIRSQVPIIQEDINPNNKQPTSTEVQS